VKISIHAATMFMVLLIFKSPPSLAQQPALAIFETRNLPKEAMPVYQNDEFTLSFDYSNIKESGKLTLILPLESGDYYMMRIIPSDISREFGTEFPHVTIGDHVILRMDDRRASDFSRYGWGLTKLAPRRTSNITPFFIKPPTTAEFDSNIQEIISVITPQTSRQWIADLSAITTRYSFAQGCRQAEQYVCNQFGSFGIDTSFFEFQINETVMRNVIGELPGRVAPDSIIIVCGHLDCTSETPYILAPGAEDNGTGSASVLEAARAMCQYQFELTVRFITFSGEEQGLVGSDIYASHVQDLGEHIAAVINVDMVGYSGPYAQDVHIFSNTQSHWLGALAASTISTYVTLDTVPHYDAFPQYGSDHYPFAIRNFPAIFFIDAWDGFDWYPYYHTISDTLGNLNMSQQAAIGQAATALAATLARPIILPRFIPGDANGNDEVNGVDVIYLVNYLKGIGPPPPDPILRADANGNCEVNGVDVAYLVNYLKGMGPEPMIGNCP